MAKANSVEAEIDEASFRKCVKCGKTKHQSKFRVCKKPNTFRSWCKQCEADYKVIWRSQNKEKCRKSYAKWLISNRERHRGRYKRYREEHPKMVLAQQELNRAIMRGEIVRPSACSINATHKDDIEAHHEDYAKPLEVIWFCKSCHRKLHKKQEAPDADK